MTLKQDLKALKKEFKELGKKVTKLTKAVAENGDVRSIYLFWQFSYIKRPYQRSVIQYQFLNFTSP